VVIRNASTGGRRCFVPVVLSMMSDIVPYLDDAFSIILSYDEMLDLSILFFPILTSDCGKAVFPNLTKMRKAGVDWL
jgi:hypothetical protein